MLPNNNLSVLPFYPSLDFQNAKKWWVYDRVYPLFRANYGMPCFQAIIPYATRQQYIDFALRIINVSPDGEISPQNYIGISWAGGFIKDFPSLGYSVIVCCPGYDLNRPAGYVSNGRYCFSLHGVVSWSPATYSEALGYTDVITVVGDLEPYLKLEWWDDDDFIMDAGTIVYNGHGTITPESGESFDPVTTSFKNVVYLKADIAKPEYIFDEEGENRDGYFYPSKMISEKRYKFSFFACEYLLDVLRFVRMSDHIRITYHGQVYDCDSFLMTPEWEKEGDVAVVNCEFDTATVAKKIGVGYKRAARGDFNADFNNDF